MVCFGPGNQHPPLLAPAGSPSRGESPGSASFGVDPLAALAEYEQARRETLDRVRAVAVLARLRALVEERRISADGVSFLIALCETLEVRLECDRVTGTRPAAG